MTDLWETGLIEGLPPAVASEPWVRIIDMVYRARQEKERREAERIAVYTQIDSQPEEILDVLAVQFKVDWYDAAYPLEAKRRIIKTALEVRRCGPFPQSIPGQRLNSGTTTREHRDTSG